MWGQQQKLVRNFFFILVLIGRAPQNLSGLFFPSSRRENALYCCLFLALLVPLSPPRAVPGTVTLLASEYLCCFCPAVTPARSTALPGNRGLQKLLCFLACVISCRNVNNPFPRNHWRGSVQLFCHRVLLLHFVISAVAPALGSSPFPCFFLKKDDVLQEIHFKWS